MRSHARAGAVPPTLSSGGKAATTATKVAAAIASGEEPKFPAHWNEPDVRGVLYASFGRVCCYCGCDLPRNDRGDVEHYRPKGGIAEDDSHTGYYWLAYELSNYVVACSICNSGRKGARFPLADGSPRARYETRASVASEERALLDPTADPIDDALSVDVDHPLSPIVGEEGELKERADTTIAFFALNTDVRLVRERRDAVLKWLEDLDANPAVGERRLRRAASRYSEHSLAARRVLQMTGRNVPSDDEELAGLAERFIAELDMATKVSRADPGDVRFARHVEEVEWALATLSVAPPRGRAEIVVDAIKKAGLAERIAARAEQLAR